MLMALLLLQLLSGSMFGKATSVGKNKAIHQRHADIQVIKVGAGARCCQCRCLQLRIMRKLNAAELVHPKAAFFAFSLSGV